MEAIPRSAPGLQGWLGQPSSKRLSAVEESRTSNLRQTCEPRGRFTEISALPGRSCQLGRPSTMMRDSGMPRLSNSRVIDFMFLRFVAAAAT